MPLPLRPGPASEAARGDAERECGQLAAEAERLDADLDMHRAVALPGYRRAADRQLELWRAWLDNLRIQARLGRVEVHHDLDERIHSVESAYEAARRRLA